MMTALNRKTCGSDGKGNGNHAPGTIKVGLRDGDQVIREDQLQRAGTAALSTQNQEEHASKKILFFRRYHSCRVLYFNCLLESDLRSSAQFPDSGLL